MSKMKQSTLIFIFCLGLLNPLVNAQDADPDLTKLVQLRQARKYDEVEREVHRMTAELGDREFAKRVLLQIELLQAQTARAFEEQPAGRIDSYRRILQTVDRFIDEQRDHPNLVLLEVQKSITSLNFGELIRMEIEAGVLRPSHSKVAFQLLREADRQLAAIDKKLGQMIPTRPRKTQDGSLTQRELISLQNQVRYQQIKSKINRGLLYGQEDPDNLVAVLTAAKSDLQKVIPLIERVDAAWWESRLDLLMILRSIAEFRGAQAFFETLPVKEAPPQIKLSFKAEMVRLALDQNQLAKAEKLIASGREIDGQDSADFDYAILEFFLQKKEVADTVNQRRIQDTLVKIVQAIEKKHGSYWGRRANMALVKSARIFGASGSTTLIRVAQDHYRKKEFEQSIAEFEKAATAARKELNRKLELELRFQAIVIHRDLGQHQYVLKKSQALGKEFRDTKRAAAVHLIGILSAAELTRKGTLPLTDYLGMIDYHLANWGSHPTVGKVARFRGEYAAAQGRHFEAAFDFQKSVYAIVQTPGALDLDGFESSVAKLTAALEEIAKSISSQKRLDEFRERFDGSKFFSTVEAKTSLLESVLSCWATYALAMDANQLPTVLDKLVAEQSPRNETLIHLIRVAVMAQRTAVIKEVIQKLRLMSDEEKQLLLNGFQQDWGRASTNQKREIAALVTRLEYNDQLTRKYWNLLTQALIVRQRRAEAISILETIQDQNPKQLKPRLILAELLSTSEDESQVRSSLQAWRRILQDTKPKSTPWFTAKYFIAQSHLRLGDSKSAATVLKLIKAIPPGWKESELSSQFDQLYAKVLKQTQ